jgi:hypothetical protein
VHNSGADSLPQLTASKKVFCITQVHDERDERGFFSLASSIYQILHPSNEYNLFFFTYPINLYCLKYTGCNHVYCLVPRDEVRAECAPPEC